MNSQTKIVVIRMKWLIIAVIAAIVLIAGIVLYFNMGKNDSGSSSGNARMTSTDVKSAADTDSSDVRNSTYKNSPVTYTPGVYTASIMLDGNPRVKEELEKRGCEVKVMPGNWTGYDRHAGPTCMTMSVLREYE